MYGCKRLNVVFNEIFDSICDNESVLRDTIVLLTEELVFSLFLVLKFFVRIFPYIIIIFFFVLSVELEEVCDRGILIGKHVIEYHHFFYAGLSR